MYLVNLPLEILDTIARHVACDGTRVQPLTPLLSSCKTIHSRLRLPTAILPPSSPDSSISEQDGSGNAALYASIFRSKFSYSCVQRRLFTPTAINYAEQLVKYCRVLRYIRRRKVSPDPSWDVLEDDFHLDAILSAVFVMLLDDDGRNMQQLNYVGAYDWVMSMVMNGVDVPQAAQGMFAMESAQGLLYPQAEVIQNGGYSCENARNVCALWIIWMMTTSDRIAAESDKYSEAFINLILPFALATFRYSPVYAPPNHFHLPLNIPRSYVDSHKISVPTQHGPWPVYRPDVYSIEVHFGHRVPINFPPISIAAKLLYFSRRERLRLMVPPHFAANRAEAIERARSRKEHWEAEHDASEPYQGDDGRRGPTREDFDEFDSVGKYITAGRKGRTTLSADIGPGPRSLLFDDDWWRMNLCWDPFSEEDDGDDEREVPAGRVYTPGRITGLWAGRMLLPDEGAMLALLTHQSPTTFNPLQHVAHTRLATIPLYMRLSEHAMPFTSTEAPCGGSRPKTQADHYPLTGDSDPEHEWSLRDIEAEFDHGLRNGWFPDSTKFRKERKEIEVRVDNNSIYHYKTLELSEEHGFGFSSTSVGCEHDSEVCSKCISREQYLRSLRDDTFESVGMASECDGIRDIIVTGETDPRHSAAWQPFTFYGRVRAWDGLIGILRMSTRNTPGEGVFFMYGYIVGGRNFVGNWRMARQDVRLPCWEGMFSLGRRE